jgi:hypothetical protein
MKLKLVIVDLEMSPRAKKIALRIGLPAVILGMATVAYAGVPVTFTAGTTLHAADLNTNFSALDARITTLETSVPALQTSVSALQAAPAAPLYAAQIYDGTTQTVFTSSGNIPNAPGATTPIVVTRTQVGGYNVQWVGSSFPNGSEMVFSVLENGYTTNVTGLLVNQSTTANNGIYLETLKAGVLTDAFFSISVVGQPQ